MAAVNAIVTFSSVSASGAGGLLIGIFGVREVLLVGGVISAAVLIVFGPAVLRAGRRSALQDSQTN